MSGLAKPLARTPPPMSPPLAAFALALLMGLQSVTTDIIVPALPMLTQALGARMAQAQLTMSVLILTFGITQMVWGPVADRVGRRPVLLAGLALYVVASAGCVLAGSIGALIAWRGVQGAGLAAAVVCARAIVRDLYPPLAGARVMALALSGLGVIAVVGPPLGGAAAAWLGWRGTLGVIAAAGALALGFVAWRLPETLPAPSSAPIAVLPRTWWQIARHPVFSAWTLLVACSYGGVFTLLAASSFVYIGVLGLSPQGQGAVLAMASLSYLTGTLVCRRWIVHHGLAGAVRRGAWFSLAGGGLMAAGAASGLHALWSVLLPHGLFMFGHGMHQPCGQAGIVAPFPRAAGAASALAGLGLALVAFAVGQWLGLALDGTLRPMAYTLGFWAVATAVVAWRRVPRDA
ncbi:MAG: Bcr/CflA family efflux MFS transporter [Burkholderiales bacterium]|nr:Bcr/CflA family efflux MFS transporter [Burkholderiales bacterium]